MIIRLKLFSKKKENKQARKRKEKIKDQDLLGRAILAGAVIPLKTLPDSCGLAGNLANYGTNHEATENSRKVYDALIKNSDGVKVNYVPDHNLVTGPAYLGIDRKVADKNIKKIYEVFEKKGLSKEEIKKNLEATGLDNIGRDAILLPKTSLEKKNATNVASLAHELGHSKYSTSNEYRNSRTMDKGGVLGRYSHKISAKIPGFLKNSRNQCIGSFATGIASGYRGSKQKDENGEESTLNRITPYAIPSAINAPSLSSEAAASIKGLKLLKKYGADKATMSRARKTMAAAGSTYALAAAMPLSTAYAGRQLGKYYYRKKKENGSKKKKN